MKPSAFTATLLDGHKGAALEVPFDPASRWNARPVPLRPGRRGTPVHGSLNGRAFESAVVPRSKRFFLLVSQALQAELRLRIGSTVRVSLAPGPRREPVAGRSPKAADGDAAKQLEAFIGKFGPEDQRLIRAVRKTVRRWFPTANELVWDNYNFFVIGYSPTERPSDSILSIAARANGVGLCFIRGAGLPDPAGLLLGSGSQTRFLRVPSAGGLARPEVAALVAAAIARAKPPLPAAGRGRLLIRSVSAKQRPRRAQKK